MVSATSVWPPRIAALVVSSAAALSIAFWGLQWQLPSSPVLAATSSSAGDQPVDSNAVAKALGATVIATAGSDEKCAACLALGADHAINYKTADFSVEAKRLTDGKGVNVILDMVAGSYVAREVECLAEDGRLVIIAVQGGVKAEFNAGMVLRKRLSITGSTLRPRPIAFKTAIAQSLRAKVWPLLESGAIKPAIFKTFPADAAAQAHALMESNQHIGKIILTWSGEKQA